MKKRHHTRWRITPSIESCQHEQGRGYNRRLNRFGIPNSEEDVPDTMIAKEKQFPTSTAARIRARKEAENNRGLLIPPSAIVADKRRRAAERTNALGELAALSQTHRMGY